MKCLDFWNYYYLNFIFNMKKYNWLKCSAEWFWWWQELIENVFEGLDEYIKDLNIEWFSITYMKEKYWHISVEWSWWDEYINDLIFELETVSSYTCQECWHTGKLRWGNWIRTLCNKHYEERNTMKAE